MVAVIDLGGFLWRRMRLHLEGGSERINRWLSGEWAVQHTNAKTRRIIHYWATVLWLTVGTVIWILLRNVLWFVGFMSLYAIWITHLAGGR